MSFADTSSNLRLDGSVLHASVQNGDGDWGDVSLDLNTILGNNDGSFAPSGENFFESAEGVWLEGTLLRGRLLNVDGEWLDSAIDLNAFVGNDNGHLVLA